MTIPIEIVAHDAEHEIYRHRLPEPRAFRSRVTVSRSLKTTKTQVSLSANLRVTDVMSDELIVYRVADSDGRRYTLAVNHGRTAFPLLEASRHDPQTLFGMAEHFVSPDDATPKPMPVTAAPAAAKPRRERRPAEKTGKGRAAVTAAQDADGDDALPLGNAAGTDSDDLNFLDL